MNSEQLYLPRGELSLAQRLLAVPELPIEARTRKLFIKVVSMDTAFLFACKMQKNKYSVIIETDSKNAFKKYGIAPYDIIEIDEPDSADAVIEYIIQNHEKSLITILVTENKL
jgi:hypothetical protein